MATFDFLPAWESRRGFNTRFQGPELMAELDAAYFHLYGIERDDLKRISHYIAVEKQCPLGAKRLRGGARRSTAGRILELYDRFGEPAPARDQR